MKEGISQAAYARHRGCSSAYIAKLKKQGKLVLCPDGSVNQKASDDLLARLQNPAAHAQTEAASKARSGGLKKKPGPKPDADLVNYRLRQEKAKAEKLEMELAKARGELLDRKAVIQAGADAGRTLRDTILGLPAKLAPVLAVEDDPSKVQAVLKKELEAGLVEFGKSIKRLPDDA